MSPKTVEEIEKEVVNTLEVDRKQFALQLGKEAEKQGFIFLNHFQNTQTLKSLRMLARYKKAGDVAALTRSIFESALNMGLLLHLPLKDGKDRYEMFPSVELLKFYTHMAALDKNYANEICASNVIAQAAEQAKVYESRYGKPRSSWSGLDNLSICKKLDAVYPPVMNRINFFEFMYCQIYRFGSSAVHRNKMGLVQNIQIGNSDTFKSGQKVNSIKSREEGLVFYYLHGLISFIISMRILGRSFDRPSLEDYFQKRMRSLIWEQAE